MFATNTGFTYELQPTPPKLLEIADKPKPAMRILEGIPLMRRYGRFDMCLKFGEAELLNLEWQEITPPSDDGRSWRVRERGSYGYSFVVSTSGSVLAKVGLGDRGEDAPKEVMKLVVAHAIQNALEAEGRIPRPGIDMAIRLEEKDFEKVGFRMWA